MIVIIPYGDTKSRNFGIMASATESKDLEAYTVKLKAWRAGNASTLVIDAECTKSEVVLGLCTYTPDGLTPVGTYNAEIELVDDEIDSSKPFTLIISESA